MRYYEALFIVHPNFEQERLKNVVDSVENEIVKRNGVMINKVDWGKRRLAYAIDKQKYGNYILFHFEAEPAIISDLTAWMEIQTAVLAQIVIKLEVKPDIIEKDIIGAMNDDSVNAYEMTTAPATEETAEEESETEGTEEAPEEEAADETPEENTED